MSSQEDKIADNLANAEALADAFDKEITNAQQLADAYDQAQVSEMLLTDQQRAFLDLQKQVAAKQEEVEQLQLNQRSAANALKTVVDDEDIEMEEQSKGLALATSKRDFLFNKIFELIPASIFPINGAQLYDALILNDTENIEPDVGYEDFMEVLDGLSWAESAELSEDLGNYRQCEVNHANWLTRIRNYKKHQPRLRDKIEKAFQDSQAAARKGVSELMVLMERSDGLREKHLKSFEDHHKKFSPILEAEERLGTSSTTDAAANVVGVSGTASVGQIMAKADAMIEQSRDAISMEVSKQPAQERAIEKKVANIASNDDVINQLRAINNIPLTEVKVWREGLRTKKGSKLIRVATDTLNLEMPGLINQIRTLDFDYKHPREMLAFRTGIVKKYGKIRVKVLSRWDEQENTLLCHLPDYNKTALISIHIRAHGTWKIATVKNAEVKDWTYFEDNSNPPVPRGAKDIEGISLEQYAEWYEKISANAEKKGQRISVDHIKSA